LTKTRRGAAATCIEWFERRPYVLPFLILVTAALFRFYNLNWDNGHTLHPDERGIYMLISGSGGHPPIGWPGSIAELFDRNLSPLNPHYFAYGSLPYYLVSLTAGTAAFLGGHIRFLSSWSTLDTFYGLPTVGRSLSATLDLIAIVALFFLARRMFDYWTAVLALALSSWTVFDIQISHFYQVDSLLLPLVVVVLLASVIIAQTNARHAYIWGGVALGAALATKTTAVLLVIPMGVAALLVAWDSGTFPSGGTLAQRASAHYRAVAVRLNGNLLWLLGAYLLAAAVFAVCDPYAILDRQTLVADIAQQQIFLVTNDPPFAVPYTIQYAHTVPYVYQLQNLLFWCLGLPLGIAACAGVIFFTVRNAGVHFRRDQVVVLIWVAAYFLFVGRFFAKFDRYLLPITPFITMFGAALLIWLVRRPRLPGRAFGFAATLAVAAGALLYSVAYMNIYTHLNTRVEASRWIYSHVPTGSTIAIEAPWDDQLPLDEQGRTGGVYHTMNLDMYAPDGQNKIDNISNVLTHAQYIVMSSERMDRSIPKLPDRYPLSTRYYQLLLANKLNFHLVEHFQRHPQLGPFVVHDYAADESFHVYDHPDVRIYKRVASITPARVASMLTAGQPTPAVASGLGGSVVPGADTRLMLTSKQWASDQQGATLSQMFPPAGFGMRHPIIVWLFLIELLGLVAFPFTFYVFRSLPDKGFVTAKTFGLVLLGYPAWMVVRLGLAAYGRGVLMVVLAALIAAAALVALRGRAEIAAAVRGSWRPMLGGEIVFLAGFALFVVLRMWYPDLGHQFLPASPGNLGSGRMGEKQMELAFLNAIVRSRVFPPYDPFFAHGYINYYYYGFFLVGTLCKLTQIVPSTGFNLAIATFFALLVGNVFSVVQGLTRRIATGVLGAVMVAILGNLNGGWQLVRGLMAVATVHSDAPIVGGVADILSGVWQVAVARQALPPFDFWESTRIVPPVNLPITEFPYFTYLFADLHPHLIAYPMTAAALALAVNLLFSRQARWRESALTVVLGALLLGAIAVTNPWDYPTYVLVLVVGALTGIYATRRAFPFRDLKMQGLLVVALAGLSVILYLPFKHDYQTVFSTGIGLVRDVTPQMLVREGLCPSGQAACPDLVNSALRTPLTIYLEHFGLFMFVLVSYLILLLARNAGAAARVQRGLLGLQFAWYYRDRPKTVLHARVAASRMLRPRPPVVDLSLVFGFAILCLGLIAIGDTLLAFLLLILGLVVLVLQRLGRELGADELFVLAVLAVPLLLSIATQIFFVKDFLAGGLAFRMNTIFKFYNQIWVLYAVAGAVALDRLYLCWRSAGQGVSLPSPSVAHRPHAKAGAPVLPASQSSFAFAMPAFGEEHQRDSRPIARGTSAPISVSAEARQPRETLHARSRFRFHFNLWPAWTGALILLFATSLIYTYAGTVSRETYRTAWLPESSVPFTLDGMAFMKVAYPSEYGAITWLNSQVGGAQVIAEADNGYYDWRSRVSMFTGLPTIINGMHEGEQRYGDEIDPSALCFQSSNEGVCSARLHPRSSDVQQLYDSTDPNEAWRVIRAFGVRYIYVGFSERQCVGGQCYSRAGLAKFSRMVGHGLSVAYRNPGVTIYRVMRA